MRIYLIVLTTLFIVLPFSVYGKEFTRDYTYRAGDDDSKNSARSKAIEQVKLLLLEEIGIYIQSYIEIDKEDTRKESSSFLSHEIRTTTAGVTKTQVLTEEWSGNEYKLRVRITIDVEDVIKRINDTIKSRVSSQNVAELNTTIKQKDSEIAKISEELRLKKSESSIQQVRLAKLENEHAKYKLLLNEQIQQERQIKNELAVIKSRIKMASDALSNLEPGMTTAEVIRIAGKPSSRDKCSVTEDVFLNYGTKWAHLTNGIYRDYVSVEKYSGACNVGVDF